MVLIPMTYSFQALGRFLFEIVYSILEKGIQWLQQDGATPHCANVTLTWLENHFQDRAISRRCAADWAPHSPDLNPLDFHLWGFLKAKVYENRPKTITEMKTAIEDKNRSIPQQQCERARHCKIQKAH